MDKSAVLHWLLDVEAANSCEKTNGSDEGSLSPNMHKSSSPLDEHTIQHNHSHHRHQHHPIQSSKQLESASLATPYSSFNHSHISPPSTSPLVPSSSFKVPDNPAQSKPPEIVRKFLRSNTLASGYAHHRKDERRDNLGSDLAQDTGIKPAVRRDSWEPTTSPGTRRRGFPPCEVVHRKNLKNLSWSPVPQSSPDPVQPTVDLSSKQIFSPKRKMLLRTKLNLCQLSVTAPTQHSCANAAPESVTTAQFDSSPSSPPKSAPVSPSFKASQKLSTLASDAKCLSHNNLADFNSANKISDISHSTNCMAGKSSVDGQSHQADIGGLSDVSSSNSDQKILYNSGRSFSMDEDMVQRMRVSSDEGNDSEGASSMESTSEEKPVNEPENRDFEVGSKENLSHGNGQKDSSPSLEGDYVLEDTEEEEGKMTTERPSSHEEELLEILKKWYKQGFGEKDDLVRAMMLTGHRKSAHNLLVEGGKEEKASLQDVHDDGSSTNPARPDSAAKKDSDLLIAMNTMACGPSTSTIPDGREMAQSYHAPSSPATSPSSKTSPHLEAIVPPVKTTPLTSPLESHGSPPPASDFPLPITLLPLSRRKLAELDKVTCFTFDDSTDDVLDSKSPIIPSKKSSPLSSKVHSWSLSDYNSSVTSSSSRSSHVMSPGHRNGSPTVTKSSDSFEQKKWAPLRRDYSVFTVPENKDTCVEENEQHDRSLGKSGGRLSTARQKFALGKTTSFLHDSYTIPQEKNMSCKVYKRH